MELASAAIVIQKLNYSLQKPHFHSFSRLNTTRSSTPFHPPPRLFFQRIHPSNSSTITLAASPSVEVHPKPDDSLNSSPTVSGTSWLQFAQNVSGEWDGFGADFSNEGKPIELPESVVPEAYREWEVKVFDWQTQCPTLAEPEECILAYKSIKLLPTVGCEADAATRYSIDERVIGGANSKVNAFAYQSSGCYVAVWKLEDQGMSKTLEVESCLINPQDRESRVRIIQVIHVDNSTLSLKNIRVFCEQWYGPFRNGDQLGGCAIRDSAFASTEATKTSDVIGLWQGPRAVAKFNTSQNEHFQELIGDNIEKSLREESNLILLPKQLWSSLKAGENGDICCEVGWVFEHVHVITSRCIFSDTAKLKEISVALEDASKDA